MPVKLNSTGGGSVTLTVPATASDFTATFPANTGNVVTDSATQTLTNKTISAPTISGATTFSGDATFNAALIPSSSFLRNRIINGDMRIDQRNNGSSVNISSSGDFGVDRWYAVEDSDGTMTMQRSTTVPAGFTNSMVFTTGTADTSLGATQFVVTGQQIEGVNVYDLGWGTASALSVTLSFWVRSSLTGTFGGAVRNSASNRSYPFTYSISVANTWELKSVTIPGDTSGTWLTDTGIGIRLTFGLGVGSTYSGTAGSWSGSNFFSATSAVSVIGTASATWFVTGVQLEVGTAATPFERRQYGQELALCQRYFQRMENILVFTSAWSTTPIMVSLRATMRAVPTVALSALSAGSGGAYGALDENVLYQSVANSSQATGRLTASAEL